MKTFPDINALSMYVALVKTKSFKDAAKECGVTPSSVSQAVRALEEQYQVVLIDRSVRPIGVTLQGRNFFKSALTIVENVKALKQSVLVGSDCLSAVGACWKRFLPKFEIRCLRICERHHHTVVVATASQKSTKHHRDDRDDASPLRRFSAGQFRYFYRARVFHRCR